LRRLSTDAARGPRDQSNLAIETIHIAGPRFHPSAKAYDIGRNRASTGGPPACNALVDSA
jgi:hypothetical protein